MPCTVLYSTGPDDVPGLWLSSLLGPLQKVSGGMRRTQGSTKAEVSFRWPGGRCHDLVF
jgi:hypothetical protein